MSNIKKKNNSINFLANLPKKHRGRSAAAGTGAGVGAAIGSVLAGLPGAFLGSAVGGALGIGVNEKLEEEKS